MQDLLHVTDAGIRTAHRYFVGPIMPTANGRSFGGQVMGQGVMAAGRTVLSDRILHSMHGYFLRPGDASQALTFEVAELFDGRSFSTRRVQAFQNGTPIMSLIASFQTEATGPEQQADLDVSQFPEPESVPSLQDRYGHLVNQKRASWALQRPFEFRHIEGDVMMEAPEPSTRQHVWMRSVAPLDDDPMLHRGALAFGSDYLLIEPGLRSHGLAWATPGIRAASLDHSVWFHRSFRADEWLLYVLDASSSQSGRALAQGRFYDRAGRLVASVAQESMLRVPEDSPDA